MGILMKRCKLLPVQLASMLLVGCSAAAEEKVLYEKDSRYNTILVTEDDEGIRTLRFEKGGIRQSVVKVDDPDHLPLPYTRAMPMGMAFTARPKRILVIGLGGGSIPRFLHKHYPETTIDAVDIDPDVVAVAKRFFGFREDATLHAYADDGRRFIEKCKDPYDVIFLDAYGAEEIPYTLATREFMQAVRRALTPDGIVVGNVFSRNSNRLYDSMVRTYQDVFDELYIFDVRGAGNNILIARKQKRQIPKDELAKRARRIAKERDFPFDLDDLVTYGYRYVKKTNARGQVLTDKNPPEKR